MPFFVLLRRAHKLRLQAIATPLVPNMEKVQIIPLPADVDARVLVWKGAAVLGKMEGVSDLWVTPADWVRARPRGRAFCPRLTARAQDVLGMRGLKERCFFI